MFIPRLNPDGTFQVTMRELPFEGNPDIYCKGSYNVIAARLLGFTYPDYLRYCRAHGGILRGKAGYSFCVFKEKKDCDNICRMLNVQMKRLEEKLNA